MEAAISVSKADGVAFQCQVMAARAGARASEQAAATARRAFFMRNRAREGMPRRRRPKTDEQEKDTDTFAGRRRRPQPPVRWDGVYFAKTSGERQGVRERGNKGVR